MQVYRVVLPLDSPLDRLQLKGLGAFERGVVRELELSDKQRNGLKARGLKVTRKAAEPAPGKEQDHGDVS